MIPYTTTFGVGFCPSGLSEMLAQDPETGSNRYQDICGIDIGKVMDALEWHFCGQILNVSLRNPQNQVVAVAFAAPIQQKKQHIKGSEKPFFGVNLSYAVSSLYTGQGLGRLASSVILAEMSNVLDLDTNSAAILNIQTRLENKASNQLLNSITGDSPLTDASFSVELGNPPKPVAYSGGRVLLVAAIERAHQYLVSVNGRLVRKEDEALGQEDLLASTPAP